MTLLGCELKLKGEQEELYSNETRRCVTHALAAVASAGGAGWCLLARYKNKNINRRDRE